MPDSDSAHGIPSELLYLKCDIENKLLFVHLCYEKEKAIQVSNIPLTRAQYIVLNL